MCCLAAVPSVTITTPRYYRPPASQPGWYSGGRGINLSARIKCVASPPPPHARNQISCGCFHLDIQSCCFFSVGWRWSDDSPRGAQLRLSPSSVVAASCLRLLQEVVSPPPDVLHVTYTSPCVIGFPPCLRWFPGVHTPVGLMDGGLMIRKKSSRPSPCPWPFLMFPCGSRSDQVIYDRRGVGR